MQRNVGAHHHDIHHNSFSGSYHVTADRGSKKNYGGRLFPAAVSAAALPAALLQPRMTAIIASSFTTLDKHIVGGTSNNNIPAKRQLASVCAMEVTEGSSDDGPHPPPPVGDVQP